ncbi:MAG TPA: metallophosphoesterase [Spirochaetota bacterium]|nr:metallophosphoesterase [Spirochaetota bacterium]HPJ43796.1 metallophosphoesterase [Spirochaetota bacterium]HPR38962.1 metallophosphoesterase [Spirochaetota bacterium]
MRSPLSFFIFISIVITIYSLMNYYFIRKHRNILTGRSLPAILFRLILVTVILAPIATVFFSQKGEPLWAAVTGFTGYGWLAFLFLFLVIHGMADIILYITEKAGFIPPGYMAREVLAGTLILSISLLAYGFYEADSPRVERLVIETEKIPSDMKSLKIMQVSDIHFSPIISTDKAEDIKKIAEHEKPDIIVSTGDFLDRSIRNSDEVAAVMRSIAAPEGKYAITGNHEFITGVDESVQFIEKSGFIMLRNRAVTVAGINLAGVDDYSGRRLGFYSEAEENSLLAVSENGLYTILLKHQPRISRGSVGRFDLQLSGHTHGGQIFPFTLLVKLSFPYLCGEYDLGNGSRLYVSRGTGTWGPPVRFIATPEVTVIELRRKKSPSQ